MTTQSFHVWPATAPQAPAAPAAHPVHPVSVVVHKDESVSYIKTTTPHCPPPPPQPPVHKLLPQAHPAPQIASIVPLDQLYTLAAIHISPPFPQAHPPAALFNPPAPPEDHDGHLYCVDVTFVR